MSSQYTESYVGGSPTLAESVESAVSGYLEALDDQNVSDLYGLVLSQVEAPLIECVLKFTDNNQSQTAEILGLNRGTLRKKLKKYGML
ncbi:MAG: DNA-binding transcriptional regulator Fis [Pseudomonadales bacterium]